MSPALQNIMNLPMSELSAKSGDELLKLVDDAEALLEKAKVRMSIKPSGFDNQDMGWTGGSTFSSGIAGQAVQSA